MKEYFGRIEFNNVDYKNIYYSKDNMFYSKSNSFVLFYGLIYNRQELCRLINKSYNELTDAELFYELISKYDTDILNKIDGAYSCVFFDANNNTLVLCRDKFGIKPLYYSINDKKIYFSTRLKKIPCKKIINKKALYQYLFFSYIPAPLSIYEDVCKLEKGTYIKINNSNISKNKYWDINVNKDLYKLDYTGAKKQLRDLVFKSVEEKIDSNVNFGAFLSGGIDSTVISSVASLISGKSFNTYTLDTEDSYYNEISFANITAEKIKSKQNKVLLSENKFIENYDDLIENLDEPYSGTSYICQYFILKEAEKSCDALIGGDGGDELFSGYRRYFYDKQYKQYIKIPKTLRKNIIEKLFFNYKNIYNRLSLYSNNTLKDINVESICLVHPINKFENLLLSYDLSVDFLERVKKEYDKEFIEDTQKLQYLDLTYHLEGDSFYKADYSSRKFNINVIAPLVNQNIYELAINLPLKYKINKDTVKYILKDTFNDLIPNEILTMQKKGFSIPMHDWVKNSLKEKFKKYINKDFLIEQNIFNYDYINKLFIEHIENKSNHQNRLWNFLVFQEWYNSQNKD